MNRPNWKCFRGMCSKDDYIADLEKYIDKLESKLEETESKKNTKYIHYTVNTTL